MADLSVRPARPADADDVARVQLATWRTAYAHLLPAEALDVPQDEVAEAWRGAVERPPSARHRLLVALDGGQVVGLAASTPAADDDLDPAAVSELTALLVEPRWSRRGHGSRLLAATVDHWRADGVRLGVLWAWQRDEAVRSLLGGSGWAPDGAVRGLDTGARVEPQLRLHTSLEDP